jgi:hypothetical protein
MPVDVPTTDRDDPMLAELAELSLALARDLQSRALAATDDAVACELSLAFHRVARSLRQTLALRGKLERDAQRGAAADRAEAAQTERALVQIRRTRVKDAVERVIWNEAEDDDVEHLLGDLYTQLDEEALLGGFAGQPLETFIATIHRNLGLPAPAANAVAGAPLASGDGVQDGERQSSA